MRVRVCKERAPTILCFFVRMYQSANNYAWFLNCCRCASPTNVWTRMEKNWEEILRMSMRIRRRMTLRKQILKEFTLPNYLPLQRLADMTPPVDHTASGAAAVVRQERPQSLFAADLRSPLYIMFQRKDSHSKMHNKMVTNFLSMTRYGQYTVITF